MRSSRSHLGAEEALSPLEWRRSLSYRPNVWSLLLAPLLAAAVVFLPAAPANAHTYAAPIDSYYDPPGSSLYGCHKPQVTQVSPGDWPDDYESTGFAVIRGAGCAGATAGWNRLVIGFYAIYWPDIPNSTLVDCGVPGSWFGSSALSGDTTINTIRYGNLPGWFYETDFLRLSQVNAESGYCGLEDDWAFMSFAAGGSCIQGDCYDVYREYQQCDSSAGDREFYVAVHTDTGGTSWTTYANSSC
jgi:hypothetical protein